MGETSATIQPRELSPRSREGLADRLRGLLGRPAPRAQVTAPPTVRLGQTFEASWRFAWGAREVTNVAVSLVGAEVARRRISARTGISVVTETRPFLTLPLDRQMPERGASRAEGRGTVGLPMRALPSLTGRLHEIAWSLVLEAAFQATPIWRAEFSVLVLPPVHPG
jgi:hypothetical protein